MTPRYTLTEEIAGRIYDILVEDCLAAESMRDSWMFHQTNPKEHTSEWRFIGNLGFGGKFWRNAGKWYVDAYTEDYSPERNKVIATVNEKLVALRKEFNIPDGYQYE